MWDRLQRQVALERGQLAHLIEVHRALIAHCAHTPPSAVEVSALAAMLHSYYTGIENILKRIALEVDGAAPRGEAWHRQLLDSMTACTLARPAVISRETRDRLREYLAFRHAFRQAYAFELHWEKMAGLVLDCEDACGVLGRELDAFLSSIRATPR